jgi:hypothetical protein
VGNLRALASPNYFAENGCNYKPVHERAVRKTRHRRRIIAKDWSPDRIGLFPFPLLPAVTSRKPCTRKRGLNNPSDQTGFHPKIIA